MKSIICSVLIGLSLVTVFILAGADALTIDSTTQNEINRRVWVAGAMGGNITLVSNSSLGSGVFGFVLSGEAIDGTPVAIKATHISSLAFHTREYGCYKVMNATMDKVCEKYGVPFIYHSGDFLEYKTMAMTMLDFDLDSLQPKFGSFSKDTILIIFRDMIKTLKFAHSKGIIHQDIKSANIMTKGANIFLMDFNSSTEKRLNTEEQNELFAEDYDMRMLFTTMAKLVGMPHENFFSPQKRRTIKEDLLKKIKHTELVEPFVEFYFDAIEAMEGKRLPKYDYLYKMFDDLLYAGRNRSERIVFEWLTPEEKTAAMAECILPIESIVFPDENAH